MCSTRRNVTIEYETTYSDEEKKGFQTGFMSLVIILRQSFHASNPL